MKEINKANQYLLSGEAEKAEAIFRAVLKVNGNHLDALWGLGKAADLLGNYQASYDIFTRCIIIAPHIPPLWHSKAQACERLRRFTEAEKCFINALELKKDYIPSLLALSIFYCQTNHLTKASEHLNHILALSPYHVNAFCLKVRIKEQSINEPLAQYFIKKLSENKQALSIQNQISLHYALATLFEEKQDYKQAFFHLSCANENQFNNTQFKVRDMSAFFNELKEVFNQAYFEDLRKLNTKSHSVVPIFIIGQPRSGSTLLEQILSEHTKIRTAGELPWLAGEIAKGIFQLTGQAFPKGVLALSEDQRQLLRKHYLTNLQNIAPDAKYIIDKMPANYQSVGLIKMLFPEAKIIHIVRNTPDVVWSIYSNYFMENEPYFCSLSEITAYHNEYQKMMTHWSQIIPSFIHTIHYEKLVEAPEKELKTLLSFVGVSFEEDLFSFTNKNQHVATLSDLQVRGRIQRNKDKKWLPYRDFLPNSFKI